MAGTQHKPGCAATWGGAHTGAGAVLRTRRHQSLRRENPGPPSTRAYRVRAHRCACHVSRVRCERRPRDRAPRVPQATSLCGRAPRPGVGELVLRQVGKRCRAKGGHPSSGKHGQCPGRKRNRKSPQRTDPSLVQTKPADYRHVVKANNPKNVHKGIQRYGLH